MRHEFLNALENHGCVGPEFGWIPCHIGIYEGDDLIAAMPLYQKFNSYGEFVFDHAWADAYKRSGLEYFPKLVSSIPYTPASGQRLLSNSETPEEHYQILMQTVAQFADDNNLSSFHCLFANSEQIDWLSTLNLNGSDVILRHDCQFHQGDGVPSSYRAYPGENDSPVQHELRRRGHRGRRAASKPSSGRDVNGAGRDSDSRCEWKPDHAERAG